MASTYTTFLGIEKPGTGEQSGTWGDTVNTNSDIIDQAVDGIISITLAATGSTGSPNSLPITDGAVSNGRNKYIEFVDGGDIGGTVYVQLTPNNAEKIVHVRNSLSGSRSILIFQGTYNASNDFELLAGKDYVIKFNGGGSGATVTDANADLAVTALTAATLNATTFTASGVITGSTVEATGDTAAGDNAAIGFTAAEGLILTGQGSTNDVTIKNDADADVLEIPTGTVNVTVAGDLTAAGTLKATGDTAAGDGAALGFTAAEGLILTGQGSTNDVTIKNDADADVIEIPTGTVNVTVAGDLTAAGTLKATGDTAAGDGAALGFTAAEGLILTGQGSTNDVTIKNDADADVIEIPTGTTTVNFAGAVTGASTITATSTIVGNAGLHVKNGATGAGFVQFFEDSDNGTNTVTLAGPASTADITLTLPSSTGNNGEALVTNGSGVLSFAAVGGAYDDWEILTSATNLDNKGQYISNKTSALTHTLPSGSAGSTVILKATGGGTVTIARTSSQKINSVAADGTLSSGNAVQLVFVDATIGWLEL
jgi:hypothetical protein